MSYMQVCHGCEKEFETSEFKFDGEVFECVYCGKSHKAEYIDHDNGWVADSKYDSSDH